MNTSSTETGLIQDKSINVSMEEIGSWRKSSNSSEEILDYLSSPEIVHSWEANPNNNERRKK